MIKSVNKIHKKNTLLFILFFSLSFCMAQKQKQLFDESYSLLTHMIEDQDTYSFKKAVFSVENAYLNGKLDTVFTNETIQRMSRLTQTIPQQYTLTYNEKDKDKVYKWAAVFKVMTDTIPIDIKNTIYHYIPPVYDFNDVFGHNTRENLFVSKLLATHSGNCHSLPYLYKMLAEELGVDASLALAPNHVYIKLKNIQDGWYNTELTSGIFPTDAWIMASGYVHIDAIANGMYMKALNNPESIALLLIDLADNYKTVFPENDGSFILKCCEAALKQYPNLASALLLKAETKYNFVEKEIDLEKQKKDLKAVEKEYAHLHQLGYRQMPESMYLNWLMSLKTERNKYENQNLNK